jgi:hypothetical protein
MTGIWRAAAALVVTAAACVWGTACPEATAEQPATVAARDVIVRGRTRLVDALRLAARDAWNGETPRHVAVVVDVTPYTQRWGDVLTEALFDVEVSGGTAAGWRIAPLGGRFGAVAPDASQLAPQLNGVLAEMSDVTSTLDALTRTLRGFGERGGVVVYLADWHFEDDHALEGVLKTLRGAGQTLSVIGSEAASGRGWNDGFAGFGGALSGDGPYVPGIGRNPFGGGASGEPWHGGDTAYPHVPWRFSKPDWRTEFGAPLRLGPMRQLGEGRAPPAGAGGDAMEDLRERLRREVPREKRGPQSHPLPSSWGPYGLMRLAAETGGRYVLWSWNPNGRPNVTYDFARCNLFQPDLRSRSAIRSDVPRRPLAAALIRAWHIVAGRGVGTVTVTPPLAKNLRGAREMLEANVNSQPPFAWRDEAARDDFVRRVAKALPRLDRALTDLDRAIAGTPDRCDDIDLRYLADAHALVHALRAQRFGLGEALAVARTVKKDAWDGDTYPALRPVAYVARGADPDRVRALRVPTFERELGPRLVEERRHALTRYGGTPFGELAARNDVVTYEIGQAKKLDPSQFDLGRTPAESSSPPPPITDTGSPGGGSGGAGGSGTGR